MLLQTTLLVFCIWCFIQETSGGILSEVTGLDSLYLYKGFYLVKIKPTTQEQFDYVFQLQMNPPDGMDFWSGTGRVNQSAHVMLSPESTSHLLDMRTRGLEIEENVIADIGKVILQQITDRLVKKPNFFEQYRSLKEINDFMAHIVNQRKDIASLTEIGRSTENKPLYLIKLSTSKDSKKPVIWIHSGAHACEHIGPAVALYILQQFVSQFGRSDEVKRVLNAFDLYLLPLINPDGYNYAFTKDRLWRKTRSFNSSHPQCVGVDLNRNWDFHWNEASGSNSNPCAFFYAGPAAFSEPEARALSDYMLKLIGRLVLFIDMHNFSQRFLAPWGYTKDEPPNYEEHVKLAEVATKAVESVHGIHYLVGSSARILFTVSGGARDWAYGVARANFSYTVELRDDGTYGFLLPDEQIIPTCEEIWAGIKAMTTSLAGKI